MTSTALSADLSQRPIINLRLLGLLGAPLIGIFFSVLFSVLWVQAKIDDGALRQVSREGRTCHAVLDRAKYDVNNPPDEYRDWILRRLIQFHKWKPGRSISHHLRSAFVGLTLRAFWSDEERDQLYKEANNYIEDCPQQD